MKKSFKKFGVIVLALAMVFALTATAWAATDVYSGSGKTEATITGTNIPLTKGIVLFNTDGSEIREPNISFTYTVTPIDPTAANQGKPLSGVTVTDDGSKNSGTPVTVTVNDGVAAAITTSTLTLEFKATNPKVAAAQTGTEVEKTGNFVVDATKFPHAGVYRYKISETANPSDVTTVGLDARDTAAYDSTRYLDVYIKNVMVDNDNDPSTPDVASLAMYGAVIFKTTKTDENEKGKDPITTTTDKTTGFEPGVGSTGGATTYEDDKTVDKYHTFNLEVNKTTTGAAADLTHDFPFEITLKGNKSATIIADYSKTGATYAGTGTEPTTVNINTTAAVLTPALSNGDSVKITGIPVGTTVKVGETNDTYDTYNASLTTKTGLASAAMTATNLAKDASVAMTDAVEITDKTQNSVIGLTNNLAEISVTGITLRVAPFAAMAGAGVLFLAISKKSKKEEEEE